MGIFTTQIHVLFVEGCRDAPSFRTSSLLGKDFKDESKMAEVGGGSAGMTVGSGILAGA